MNRPIVSTWKTNPSRNAPTDATFAAIPCTSACAFAICRRIDALVSLVSNHRCVYTLAWSSQPGTRAISSCTWSITSGTISARLSSPSRPSPSSTQAAATPRFHPRATSQFTAGSRAKDRNRAATSHRSRCESLLIRLNAAYAANTVMTTARSSRGIHGGKVVASPVGRPTSSAPRVWASVRTGSGVPAASGSAGGSCAAAGSIGPAYRPW